tara:strand:- start:451 stop:753 length:303 start_codon:yes stop_codon:yes gene_type:complete
MLSKLRKNYLIIISTFLILYFSINLFGGARGLFSYMEKKETFHKLLLQEIDLNKKINNLEHKNTILTDDIDYDYIDILIREKFMLSKKGESTYIVVDNDN